MPLAITESIIDRALRSKDPRVDSVIRYVRTLGGKRLRPILCLLAAETVRPDLFGNDVLEAQQLEVCRLAAVIELVHTATLVHDDVIDSADTRRHQRTVHEKWEPNTAILCGDWIFTQAYRLANEGESTIPGRWVAEAAKRVCEGEIAQGLSVGRFDIEQDEVLEHLRGKTGRLCGAACQLGAWAAGADSDEIDAFQNFGESLGVAFQLRDDWLDYWGRAADAGKPIHSDLRQRKPTVPLIYALTELGDQDREELQNSLVGVTPIPLQRELALINKTQAKTHTEALANQFASTALAALDKLHSSDSASQLLRAVASLATQRLA